MIYLPHRRKHFRAGGFDPLTLSPTLWLDASDASTLFDATSGGSLVAVDGQVARIEDKSGLDRHFTQGTSGQRPLRKANIQGGNDALLFDGTNDILFRGSHSIFRNVSAATLVAVRRLTSTSPFSQVVTIRNSGGATLIQLGANRTSNRSSLEGRRIPSDSFSQLVGTENNMNVWDIQTGVADFANGDGFLYHGEELDVQNLSMFTSGSTEDAEGTEASIMGNANTSSQYSAGYFGEAFAFNYLLDSGDLAALWGYLGDKWSIAL